MIVTERPPCDAALVRTAPETPGCASHARRWVLAATIFGSSLAFLMASIINVALPAIQQSLGATVPEMQWVATAYTVLLAALTLVGGAVGDRYGRRRAFQAGVIGLTAASIAGSFAPDVRSLIAARAAQGLAAALLVPNSLALLSAAFPRAERGRAIATWSAATAIVGAVSPMLGGWFVDVGSWRTAFLTIVPPALALLAIAAWRVPDPPALRRSPPVDWGGAILATLGLFGVVTGIIAIGSGVPALIALGIGSLLLAGFVRHEHRTATPMLPPALFGSPAFVGVNVLTVLVYGGVAGAFFVLPFALVQVQGYSSTATGGAFLPFAILVGVLSRRVGRLADGFGTKRVLVTGAVLTGLGVASLALPGGVGSPYWKTFLAPMLLTGLGMAFTAGPLTTNVLASVEPANAGVASGVNNTAARLGTLLAVAIIGVVALHLYTRALEHRLTPVTSAEVARALVAERRSLADVTLPTWIPAADRARLKPLVEAAFLDSFRGSVLLCAALVFAGALIALATLEATEPGSARDERFAIPVCVHVAAGTDVPARTPGCEECVRKGDPWVHLRVCVACGTVGCCDSSKNQHATKHFWATHHPIVRSLEPGEDWRWCYVDEVAV